MKKYKQQQRQQQQNNKEIEKQREEKTKNYNKIYFFSKIKRRVLCAFQMDKNN